MEHLSKAWETLSRDLVAWIIFFVVGAIVTMVTCYIGIIVVAPAYQRAARKAVFDGTAPAVGDLFDTSHLMDDLVFGLVWIAGNVVCSFVPVIGPFIFLTIAFFAAPLYFDGRYAAFDAFKASLAYAKLAFVDIFILVILGMVLGFVGILACFVGVLVTGPLTMVLSWTAYAALQSQILAAAQAEGIPALR